MSEEEHALGVYPRRGISIVRGEGATLWDSEGKEYIDCIAGHGVANVGHCNEEVVRAIEKQAHRLITCPGTFFNDVRSELIDMLVRITPDGINRMFLCNSGAEAIEAALKFARLTTGKPGFVAAMRGFHGRTLGALSVTFKKEYREGFEPLLPGATFVPFNDIGKLEAAINEETAAIVLEVVQGEGGVRPAQKEYLQAAQKLCRERGILFIIDEVQTGFCRTGKMFACEHHDLKPDIICLAKAIAGGIPMGAVGCSDRINVQAGKHGSTFGGNPLACAAAIAAIRYMEQNRLYERAEERGALFEERIMAADLEKIRDFRRIGLMIGIELKEKSRPYIEMLADEGVLALPAGSTVIRLLPPLTISTEEIETVAEKILLLLSNAPK